MERKAFHEDFEQIFLDRVLPRHFPGDLTCTVNRRKATGIFNFIIINLLIFKIDELIVENDVFPKFRFLGIGRVATMTLSNFILGKGLKFRAVPGF